jgi:ATP-dependent Clp protease ATP-binding subunit ClpA
LLPHRYGARPLKRTIQREVETPLAKLILAHREPAGSTYVLDAPSEGAARLDVTVEAPPAVEEEVAASE